MKRIIMSLFSGLVLTLAGLLINYIHYQNYSRMLLAFRVYGGEITMERGFGLKVVKIYAMTPEQGTSMRFSFDPLTFVLSVAILSIIAYAVIFLIGRSLAKRGE